MLSKSIFLLKSSFIVLSLIAVAYSLPEIQAQEKTVDNPLWEGILSSFAIPLDELLQKKQESEWLNLLDGFSGRFSFDFPLEHDLPQNQEAGQASQGEQENYSKTLKGSLKYTPLSYWFAEIDLYYYFDKSSQAPWNPDFTYRFGYDDWHPYTLSLIYSNYQGNRFRPERPQEELTYYSEGKYALGWKFPVADMIAKPLLIDPAQAINCQINYNFTPRYFNLDALQTEKHKRSWSLGCRYPIFGKWYVNADFSYYPDREQQQPWDPDYTYGFGYSGWTPGAWSLQYNNYSGNRFSGNSADSHQGSFRDGSITLSWSWVW